MEFHEIANIFPLMDGPEFTALVEDIRTNGLLDPIITHDGKIIDGRNRYRACVEAGVAPRFEVWRQNGKPMLDWVVSKNLHRRHLNETQRGVVANKLANMPLGGAIYRCLNSSTDDHISQTKAASMMNVSRSTVQAIATVEREKPELIPLLESGEMSSHEAVQQINREKREERFIEETKKQTSYPALIIHEDCYALTDSVDPIDLLIADPPYFTDGDFTEHISLYLARVKDTGQAYVFCSADPKEIAAYLNIETYKMRLEQILVWNYNNTGQRQPNKRYTSNYQLCLYYRGPDAPPINKPSDGKKQYACQTVNAPDGRIGDRYREWQKPVDLIERFILNSSNPGDFVFDPFAGTGTTLITAAKNGRRAVGCDIDERAVDICVKRGCIRDF
ncbi:MAG: DNA modification methylase [Acidobacteria bacterium]|nr:DNA modification methylase [Acidobacteriota bacterium]